MITALLTAVIVSLTCWAIWGAFLPDAVFERLANTWLGADIVSGCPKCMPTLYSLPITSYIAWLTCWELLYWLPAIWLVSCGINTLIIKYFDARET